MERSSLYVTNFNLFNRLEAFPHTWTIWFLHDILLCKVKPKWVWDSSSLTIFESRNKVNLFVTLQRKYNIPRFHRIHGYLPFVSPRSNLITQAKQPGFKFRLFFSVFSHKSPSGLYSACVTNACVRHMEFTEARMPWFLGRWNHIQMNTPFAVDQH